MAEPIYILGGHQTDFARAWSREGQDISDMVRVATESALADAAPDASAIDTIHVGNAFGEVQRQQAHLGAMVAQVVPELWGVPAMRHEGACASSSLAALAAMAEIEAGRYGCALVLGVEELKTCPAMCPRRTRTPPPGKARGHRLPLHVARRLRPPRR